MHAGPLAEFLRDLSMIQAIERDRTDIDPNYRARLRVAVVTARNAPAHERVIHTLRQWGVTFDDAFFLGGIDKGTVLGVLKPHIFFDDQVSHLESAARWVASVHIPYGVTNEPTGPNRPEQSEHPAAA